MSTCRHIGWIAVLALSACADGNHSNPLNMVPTALLESPNPDDGALPLDTEVTFSATVEDGDSLATELTVSFVVDEDVIEQVLADELGNATFDWRTPDTPGSIEIRIAATDSGGLSGVDEATFQIQ